MRPDPHFHFPKGLLESEVRVTGPFVPGDLIEITDGYSRQPLAVVGLPGAYYCTTGWST